MRCRILLFGLVFASMISNNAWAQRGGRPGGSRPTGSGTRDPLSGGGSIAITHTSPHADEEDRVEFESQTVLIQVPVVVSDKSGDHVHGLTREDFRVLESDKERKIAAFEEINTGNNRLPTPATAANTFSNLVQDGQQLRSITVFTVDTVNTPFLDQVYGRRELIKYLANNLDPGQALALVAIGNHGVKVLSGLTTDPALLIKALKKLAGEIPAMQGIDTDAQAAAAVSTAALSGLTAGIFGAGDPQAQLNEFVLQGDPLEAGYVQARAIENTMLALLDIARSLSGIPGRKSLVWATGGFPFYMDSFSSVPGGDLSPLYERAMQAMNDAQISVYPVDVRGLVNYLPAADGTIGPGSAASSTLTHGLGRSLVLTNRSWLQASTISTLQDFANMTGGRAFYNRNDLTAGFKRAADDSNSYYLLGYYLDTKNNKPGWRKLEVKVPHKEVQVRSRNGFFVTNATVNPRASHNLDIDYALSSPFDSTGIPVTVQWQGTSAAGDKKRIAFALSVPATGVFINEADKNSFDVDFIARATKNGVAAGHVAQVAKGALPAEKLAEIKAQGIRYRNSLELEPGDYQVRFVVRDNLSGRVGSVSAPLTVN